MSLTTRESYRSNSDHHVGASVLARGSPDRKVLREVGVARAPSPALVPARYSAPSPQNLAHSMQHFVLLLVERQELEAMTQTGPITHQCPHLHGIGSNRE